MDESEFDRAVVAAALAQAGREGWRGLSVAEAARGAGLPLARVRARFPSRLSVLGRFGVIADQAALEQATTEGPVRDRLFDMIMRRIDVLQAHREGVLALLRFLPSDPGLALLLWSATQRSMRWLLEAADVPVRGVRGDLAVQGLGAVWLWTVRAWRDDESEDLSPTMAALDNALRRAEQAAGWLHGRPTGPGAASDEAPISPDPVELPPATTDLPPDPPPTPPPVL